MTRSRVVVVAGAVALAALALGLALLFAFGSGNGSGVGTSALAVGVVNAPPPPRGALVLAGESGGRTVALALARKRLVTTVLSPEGGPLSGLKVSFAGDGRVVLATPCGSGCYSAAAGPARQVEVRLSGSKPVLFRIPPHPRPAGAIVARAARVTRALKSLVYVEDLRSGPTGGLHTTWKLVAPDRVEYQIRGGSSAVVIGRRRWDRDRAGAPWRRSQQLPPLRVPQPAWGGRATNAHLIGTGRVAGHAVWIVTFANPTTPAWFTTWIDRKSYRPLRLRMTAAAHFMLHRYLAFDEPVKIRPPR